MSFMQHRLAIVTLLVILCFHSTMISNVTAQDTIVSLSDLFIANPRWDSSNTLLASVSDTGVDVEITETNSGIVQKVLTGHQDTIYSLAWSPDGNYLMTGSKDGTVKIWNISNGEAITIYSLHNDRVGSVTWSADGTRVASASVTPSQYNLHVWDPFSGQQIIMGQGGNDPEIRFSPDSDIIANVVSSIIVLQNAETLEFIQSFRTDHPFAEPNAEDPLNIMESVSWNPDGSKLVTGSIFGSVYIWDTTTLEPITILVASQNYDYEGRIHPKDLWIRDVVFSVDGERIQSVSLDGSIRIWDSSTYELLASEQIGAIKTAGWSQDGTMLAYLDSNSTLYTIPAPNISPTANAGTDQTITTLTSPASVTLDGSGSSDTDGSIVSYVWMDSTGAQVATGVSPTVELPVGVHALTLTVTDDDGATVSDDVVITVDEE